MTVGHEDIAFAVGYNSMVKLALATSTNYVVSYMISATAVFFR